MIGWVQMFETPGRVRATSARHQPLARHAGPATPLRLQILTIVSVMLTGAGSVEVSAARSSRPPTPPPELLDRRVLLSS